MNGTCGNIMAVGGTFPGSLASSAHARPAPSAQQANCCLVPALKSPGRVRWLLNLLAGLLLCLMPAVGAAQNSIRNPGFEVDADEDGKPDAWTIREGCRLDSDVKQAGNISLFVQGSAVQSPIRVKSETGYRLSVWAKRGEPGLTRLFVGDPAGRAIAATDNGGYGMSAWSGPFDWQRIELGFRTGKQNRIGIYLLPLGGKKRAWFDGLELVEDDDVRVGDLAPVDHDLPQLSAEEKERGYLPFTRHVLKRIWHTSVPTREEITETMSVQAAPGEYESVAVGVRALRALSQLRLSLSELSGADSAGINIDRDIRVVRASSRTLSSVSHVKLPLFLPRANPVDLKKNTTHQCVAVRIRPRRAGRPHPNARLGRPA